MIRIYLIGLLISLGYCNSIVAQTTEEKPNIVWLVSEDNAWHYLKLYDEKGASMPNIEKLAAEGVVFENCFSNAPVCSVARSTIISGCYAPRIGAQYHRRMQLAPMPKGLEMFPYYLQKAGYYTTNNSKEDYNLIKSDGVWNESSNKASYRNREDGQPFFHVQNYGITHEGKLHFSKGQMEKETTEHDPEKINLFDYLPATPLFKYTHAKYLDLHKKVDSAIGDFIKQLKADGLLENTIVFYYGDHGGVLPRSKGYVYESGLHVPLVVYVPEKWKNLLPFEKGSRTNAFVQFIDLAPTVLNLAGVEVPESMDGSPFLGNEVSKADLAARNTAFSYADRFDEKYDLVRAIRKGKYKYIRNYQPFNIDGLYNFYRYKMMAYKEWKTLYKEGKLDEMQQQFFLPRTPEALYDLEKDPHETQNLAGIAAHQDKLIALREELQLHVKAMPDLSFYPEPYFLEVGIKNPVSFGKERQNEIADLVAIADLSLLPFDKAKKEIKKALASDNPWKRYWGLIVCSSFGEQASSFIKKAEVISKKDSENLVRVRAAEFLGLYSNKDVVESLLESLKTAKTETEANLILNSVALLKEVNEDLEIEIPKKYFDPAWFKGKGNVVGRRLDYLKE